MAIDERIGSFEGVVLSVHPNGSTTSIKLQEQNKNIASFTTRIHVSTAIIGNTIRYSAQKLEELTAEKLREILAGEFKQLPKAIYQRLEDLTCRRVYDRFVPIAHDYI
jgi:hypothetical protein